MKTIDIRKQLFAVFFFLLFIVVNGQNKQFDLTEKWVETRLKSDLSILASDSLLGRETGTKGEAMASDYIIKQFKNIGLKPILQDSAYLQSFPFNGAAIYEEKLTSLKLNNKSFATESRFFPLKYSANGIVSGELVKVGFGINAPELNYNDYKNLKNIKGKIFVIEYSISEGFDKESKYFKYYDIKNRIDTAIANGAIAVIFVNSDKKCEEPSKKLPKFLEPTSIPVIFGDSMVNKTIQETKKINANIAVHITQKKNIGHNIVGFIDNKAPYTIVIGAHYDHLGMGSDGSRYKGKPMIHNGADDNGSGTVGLLELARYLINSSNKNNNYLFISFSGEEKGLLGSSFFVKSDAYDMNKINYMLNLDMIGRLDSLNTLTIIGTGTSPIWDSMIKVVDKKNLKIKTSASGVGGSDHTSFYLKNLPVLFFFTGLHKDYHTPFDDVEKINFVGEYQVLQYVETLITNLNDDGKVQFSKVKATDSDKPPTLKVTLGVMPDFAYSGKGFRIDGATDGKPGANAGLKAGDVIIKLGDYPIDEIQSYMKALSNFKKGDKATLIYKRGEETIQTEVQF